MRIPKDVRGLALRAGDKIRLIDIPPPLNGKPRALDGYLFQRRGGGFVMMCYDTDQNEFVSNRVYWRPDEEDIPFPRCKILKRSKPSYYIIVNERKIVKFGRFTPTGSLVYELGGAKPIINFFIKLFVFTP